MNKVIWPFYLFCTELPIKEMDEYVIVENLAKPVIPWPFSYALGVCLLGLLSMSLYEKAQGYAVQALLYVGAFVFAIVALIGIEKVISKCQRCRQRLRSFSRREFAYNSELYNLSGKKCNRCKTVEIYLCVPTRMKLLRNLVERHFQHNVPHKK